MNAASVAVPMLMTAAVLTPARIFGRAIGNNTWRSCSLRVSPMASATLFNTGSMVMSAVTVLRSMGRSEYRKRATIAGFTPIPNSGIMSASSAMEGIVCNRPAR